jgi:hypothetical protein
MFNGGVLTSDRVTKEPIRIEETNVNIIGGLQPKLLKSLASNNRNEDGFLARFLFVYPSISKPNLFTGKTIKPFNAANYKRLILNLYDTNPRTLKVNSCQINTFKSWQHKKANECFNDDLETLIQSKLETYTWRLALIIEMMEQASTNSVNETLSDASLDKAIKLIEYFRTNAISVYDKILSNNPLENMPSNKIDLFNNLPPEFKRADVLTLFDNHKIKGGSIGRFLNNKSLFQRETTTGNYKKKII